MAVMTAEFIGRWTQEHLKTAASQLSIRRAGAMVGSQATGTPLQRRTGTANPQLAVAHPRIGRRLRRGGTFDAHTTHTTPGQTAPNCGRDGRHPPPEVIAGAGGQRSQWGRVVDVFPPVTAVASPNEDRWWMSADADIHHG